MQLIMAESLKNTKAYWIENWIEQILQVFFSLKFIVYSLQCSF